MELRRIGEYCLGGAASQIATLELGTADTTCALQVPFLGPESQVKSGLCGPPLFQLYAGCLKKGSCNLLFARVGLCCDFAVSFLVPPDGLQNG